MSRPDSPSHWTEIARRWLVPAWVAVFCLGLTGCGFGTAAVVGSGGGGGGSNAPPSMSGFSVLHPKVPPSTIRFVLSDAEGNPANIELFYQAPGQAPQPMEHLLSVPSNPVQLAATPQGVEHSIAWDFAAEDFLPDDASFTDGVLVYARVHGAADVIVPGANSVQLGLGNDPPVLTVDPLPAEVSGVVALRLHMSDTSSDAIDVRIEYDVQGDDPDASWQPARPAGLLPSEPTPPFAFQNIVADDQGTLVVFSWDTDFDLQFLERDVQLRVTPIDPAVAGTAAVTDIVRVDNNAAPIVQLHTDAFIANPDSVRGIPIPFTVIDEESDEVVVVLQWRREGESFPPLPPTPPEVLAVLADPGLRRQHQICSQFPHAYEGRAVQLDSTRVHLPELAAELSFLKTDLVGRELEFTRPSSSLQPVWQSWSSNPFVHPVAVLPSQLGTHALVLDEAVPGTWRLVEVRLQDGVIERTVASGVGRPSAMCSERGEESVLVASDVGLQWSVERVVLEGGAVTQLVDASSGPVEAGEVRGIASIGTRAAVLTVGSSLVRVEWSDSAAPRAVGVRTDLAVPWGIAVDPRNEGCVLVAENAASGLPVRGRIVSVDLATHSLRPVVVQPDPSDGLAFPRPRGIALLRDGTRLLALCEPGAGAAQAELRAVDLGRADLSAAFRLGLPIDLDTTALSAGEDDLLLAVSPGSARICVAGGAERRDPIAEYDPDTAVVRLSAPLSPPLEPLARWRIRFEAEELVHATAGPSGTGRTFLWDSADAHSGPVFVRATVMDADLGVVDASAGAKVVVPPFEESPAVIPSGIGPNAVVGADVDGDGDLDLVSANGTSDNLAVFWQSAPGVFNSTPTLVGGPGITDSPASVQACDFDGDGALDLVSANSGGNNLTVFWQTAPGVFDSLPEVLGGPGTTLAPSSVKGADIDGDGDLDLVSANSGDLTVFWQTAPGVFNKIDVVGGPGITDGPIVVQVADVDGDGDLDLVSSNLVSSTLTVFWQTAAGVFDDVPSVLGGAGVTGVPSSVQAADLDGDGDLDLVSSNLVSSTLTVFWQTAPGVFDSLPEVLGGPGITPFPWSVKAADIDGDGDLDLVSGNGGSGNLTVFWQSDPGSFSTTPSVLGGPTVTDVPRSVEACDLDGDGHIDLVSANDLGNSLTVILQVAPGVFSNTPSQLGGLLLTGYPHSAQAGDLDGDGDLDLVSANHNSDNLTVFWQSTSGIFSSVPKTIGGSGVTEGAGSVRAADLDGDGDLDLASANTLSGNLTVFWQTARGEFDSQPKVLDGNGVIDSPRCVQAADLDADGDLDLVSANSGSYNLTVFWQTAAGIYGDRPSIVSQSGVADSPYFVQAADLDGDGDLDLVSPDGDNNTLTVFWQTAPGEFSDSPSVMGGPSVNIPLCVQAADLDGDGDLDLVSANSGSSNLTVFWQSARGVFTSAPTVLGGPSVTAAASFVQAADLDGDGDLDLISSNSQGNNLTAFWQTAPGVFSDGPSRIGGNGTTDAPAFVHAADLDGDGELDLVTTDGDSSRLSVFWSGRR